MSITELLLMVLLDLIVLHPSIAYRHYIGQYDWLQYVTAETAAAVCAKPVLMRP